jgi:hypothetical protein
MALCQGHDSLMNWAMVDQDLEHAIKWRIPYASQETFDRAWEDTRLTRWRENSGIKYLPIGLHKKKDLV